MSLVVEELSQGDPSIRLEEDVMGEIITTDPIYTGTLNRTSLKGLSIIPEKTYVISVHGETDVIAGGELELYVMRPGYRGKKGRIEIIN